MDPHRHVCAFICVEIHVVCKPFPSGCKVSIIENWADFPVGMA